jgi:Type IV secretion-system coupling protein DNA-binding domain/TraM recognition site of TraD and TraG
VLGELFGDTPFELVVNGAIVITVAHFAWRWLLEPLYISLKGMWNFWRLRNSKKAALEITPPKQSEKSPAATQQLLAVVQQIMNGRGIVTLEIVSTRKDGIRYLLTARPGDIPNLQRQLASYLPDAKFKTLDVAAQDYSRVHEVKQARHYAYPLQDHKDLNQADPVAYIAGAMAKLQADEVVALQIVLSPYNSYWTRKLYNKILTHGHAMLDGKFKAFFLRHLWVWIIAALIGYFTNNPQMTFAWLAILLVISMFFIQRDEPELTAAEQQFFEGVLNKLGQPLFRTDIRIALSADSVDRTNDLSAGIVSSLAPLNKPGFQQLYVPGLHPDWLGQKIGQFKVRHQMPSFLVSDSDILSASELASIYHFPYGTIQTEGMVRSHSRSLPATLGMKNNEFDVVLGRNNHHEELTDVGLTAAERERHIFIIGGTGNGKTTMLQYAIVQDIQSGKGVAVVDPHGDMAETLLRHIPEDRIKDVVYFNPDDLAHPIGLNLLELTPGLKGDELLREKDLVTESVVSIFRKIFSDDDTGGHRIEYVLRNTIQTALTTENPTLFTMFDLLNDPAYRKKIVGQLENKDLKNFWKNELGKAGGFQQVKMVAGITAKIGRFLFSASAKRILEQPKSTINFDEILDGKILICNFSKGLLGEDTSELFGISVLAKIQLASLRRARQKQTERRPFYLYVDEFQNFATPSFVQMLSEARKYKLYLTMAEQSTSQQEDQQMVNVILANVGTVICFRSGNPADEKLVLPLFQPYIKEGEIANLDSYNFYARIAASKTQEPISGETVILEDQTASFNKEIVASSRKLYAIKGAAVKTPEPNKKPPKKLLARPE